PMERPRPRDPPEQGGAATRAGVVLSAGKKGSADDAAMDRGFLCDTCRAGNCVAGRCPRRKKRGPVERCPTRTKLCPPIWRGPPIWRACCGKSHFPETAIGDDRSPKS